MAKTQIPAGYIAANAITATEIAVSSVTPAHLHTTLDLSSKTLTIGATTVSGHLIPDTNITYDLGSSTYRFRDIYLDGNTINLGGTELKKNDAGDIEFKSGSNFKKLVISELEFDDGTNRKKIKIDSGKIKTFDSSGSSDTADKISLAANKTDDLGEGTTNLYFTNERVDDRVNSLLTAGTGITLTYDDANNTLTIAGSAQYGDSDARSAISVSGNALSYNSSTGVITANYEESPTFTGSVTASNLSVTSTNWIGFGDYGERISGSNAASSLTFYTNATQALQLDSSQNATFAGNITLSGTVDGRDIAADGTKLDGIESGATADQTQSEINALGITAIGLSGTPNITVGTISSGAITSSGSVNIAGDLNIASAIAHTGDLDTYFQFNADDTARIVVGGSQKFVVNTNGVSISNGTLNMNSGNLTSVGTISSGAITSTGAIQGASFSDGTISGITFIDEDSFATNSATRVPTQQSIKAYVDAQVAGVVDSAPAALNTLNELAAALGDDANFATTTSTALGNRLRIDTASQGLTGTQQDNAITNLGITATKAELNYVDGVTSNIQTQLDAKLASSSYTAADVLTKIKTVDGSASGLDADLLDGIEASSFARTSAIASINMNNYAITNLNDLSFNDPGPNEGLRWIGGSDWRIYESPDDLSTNSGGNLQFTTGGTRRATLNTSGSLWTSGQGTLWGASNDGSGSGLDADTLDGQQGSYYQPADSSIFKHRGNLDLTSVAGGSNSNPFDDAHTETKVAEFGTRTLIYTGASATMLTINTGGSASVFQIGAHYNGDDFYMRVRTDSSNWKTWKKLWHVGNDGAGSGLDADLLDGQHGSYYAPTASPTFTGTLTNAGNLTTAANQHTMYTPHGNIQIGPMNTSWAHIYTDRSNFYFNKQLYVLGDKVWNAGNDGAGSGLDADLLDGQHGSYYQPASTAITTANIGSQSVSSASNIDGIGFVNTGSNSATNADTIDSNGISYYTSGVTNFSGNATDGALFSQRYNSSWQHQIAGDYRSGQIALRGKNNGTWQSWRKVWDASNDGSGSGLDADTLRGYIPSESAAANTIVKREGSGHIYGNYILGSYFNASSGNSENPTIGQIWTQSTGDNYLRKSTPAHFRNQMMSNGLVGGTSGKGTTNIAFGSTANSDSGFYDVYNNGTPTGTWYSLLNMAHYGGNHGHQIAGSFYSHDLYHRYNNNGSLSSWGRIWSSLCDGSGSGLDADLLDGYHASTTRNAANTIPIRDANGYLQLGWINTTSGDSGIGNDVARIYCSHDAYLRYLGKSDFKVLMGLSKDTYDRRDYTTDANYHTGVNAHGSYSMNDLFNRGSGFIDVWSSPAGRPPSGTHFNGFQALHYSASTTYHHGMQMVMSAGNPSFTYLRGWWANGGSGYDWQKIWTDGNDGSGSGLDADTVDGIQGATLQSGSLGTDYYVNALYHDDWVRNHYNNNGHYWSATGWHLYVKDAQDFYMRSGTASNAAIAMAPTGTVHGYVYVNSSNEIGFLNNGRSWTFKVDSSGNCTATGNVTAYSDIRLKEDIKPIENALLTVTKLEGVSYTRKATGKKEIGFVAQDVKKIIPELVEIIDGRTTDELEESKGIEDLHVMKYQNTVALLVEAIKEQQKQIEKLTSRINDIEKGE